MRDDPTAPNPIRIQVEPELDLHSFNPRDIPSVVEEYVHAAQAAGFLEIRLVHGRGRGVQRGIVQATLEAIHSSSSSGTTHKATWTRPWLAP